MNRSEYWIGADTEYESVWAAYEDGLAYIEKFRSSSVHLLRLELTQFDSDLPLFNHEAVFKTIKGYYHDFKRACLTQEEFDAAGPLFLYSVERGSGIWKFLGEARPLITFAATLASGRMLGQELDNIDKKLQILQRNFPGAVNPNDIQRFMKARTPRALGYAVGKLLDQGIRGVEVSRRPFDGNLKQAERTMIDFQQIIVQGDQIMTEYVGRDKIDAKEGGLAIGGSARITKSKLNQVWREYSDEAQQKRLAKELAELRAKMRSQVSEPEHDIAIGRLAEAELATASGDGPSVLKHLRSAGKWALEFATQAGATLTAEIMKKAMGL